MAATAGRRRVALWGLALATFTYLTAETLPIGLLPFIARDLAVSQTAVGLLVSAYALVVVVATIPLTALTTRMPRRLLLALLLAGLVLGSALSAAAPSYAVLLAARVLTALTQSVFWAVIVPAAADLAEPAARGRAVSTVYLGSSIAIVLGVPLGTWIGAAVDWRVAFVATGALAAVALLVVAIALPTSAPADSVGAARGTAPDRRRYGVLVVATILTVTGGMSAFTYVSPFLTDVTRLPVVVVSVLLLARGAAGLLAVLAVGRVVDRHPRATMLLALGGQAVGLLLQWVAAGSPALVVVALLISGAALAAFSAALAARVLVVAPGSTDVAAAGTSTAYNVGIMSGAFVGGAVLPTLGLGALPLLSGLLAVAAFGAMAAEPRIARSPAGQVSPT